MRRQQRVTTTYRRDFSPEHSAKVDSACRLFSANLNYRDYRRQLEHSHNHLPFAWDDWEYESELQSLNARDVATQKPSLESQDPPAKSGSLSPSSSTRHSSSPDSPSHASPATTSPKREASKVRKVYCDQQIQTQYGSDGESRDSPRSDSCDCKQTAKKASNDKRVVKSKVSKEQPPDKYANSQSRSARPPIKSTDPHFDRARPSSARARASNTPFRHPVRSASPFSQYGIGNEQRETGTKKTHNILASEGIYPGAVRAKQRQQAMAFINKADVPQQRPRTLPRSGYDWGFDRQMDTQTKKWQSEYCQRYPHHAQHAYTNPVCYQPRVDWSAI